ncbi:MAG TPA: tripartite tricarboxylate transporter TctB family protein [Paenibacillaceae bacterium]
MSRPIAGIIASIAILGVSLIFLFQSFQYPYRGSYGPGPGFFPTWMSGILLVLSLLCLIEALRGKNQSDEPWPVGQGLRSLLYVLGCLIAYVFLIRYLGYIVTGMIFLFLLLIRHYKWYIALIPAVVAPLALYYLFRNFLGILLPEFRF